MGRKQLQTLFLLGGVLVVLAVISLAAGLFGAGSSEKTDAKMPALVGLRLDVAKSDLARAGYKQDPEIVGGGTFGVVNSSGWTVCAQLPAPGEPIKDQPRLTVERKCPSDGSTSTEESTDSPMKDSADTTVVGG